MRSYALISAPQPQYPLWLMSGPLTRHLKVRFVPNSSRHSD